MNWTPVLEYCWEFCPFFLSSAALRATPAFLAAFQIQLGCSEEVIVKYRAAGGQAGQKGNCTSPCREIASGIRFLCSQTSDKLTSMLKDIILSLNRLCRETILPCPWHATVLWPGVSKDPVFIRDTSFPFYTWQHPVFQSCLKLVWQRLKLRARRWAADNQAPNWGSESDNKPVFSLSDIWFKLLRATPSEASCILLWVSCDFDTHVSSSTILVKLWSAVGLWSDLSFTNGADCVNETV